MLFVIILIALFVLIVSSLTYDHKHFRNLIDVSPDAVLYKVTKFCKFRP